MDMDKVVNLLLKKEELKDIPIIHICKVVCSLFDILANDNVFFKEIT